MDIENRIKAVLGVIHGVVLCLTILAAVHFTPTMSPDVPQGHTSIAGFFGLLTASGVIASWLFSVIVYFEADHSVSVIWIPIHVSILTALVYAWVVFVPLLFI